MLLCQRLHDCLLCALKHGDAGRNPSSNGFMKPLPDSIIQGWVQHMRYCAGLPPEPAQRQTGPPHVVFVNRAITSGRSVLPMGQVPPP